MPQHQEWYHLVVEAFKPTGELLTRTVPLNSVSISWLARKAGERMTPLCHLGFRHSGKWAFSQGAAADVLLHPTKDVVSYRFTIVPCSLLDADCDGTCYKGED
jgi:hypothetical protein